MISAVLVQADIAVNNYSEGLRDENMKDEIENENAGAREVRGREIGLMTDHGTYDIVARGAARGKLVWAKWLDDWKKNGMRSRLVDQPFNWAKRDDVPQNTPPLVAARLLVGKGPSLGHKVGAEARCPVGWDCSVAFHHASLDVDIFCHPAERVVPGGIRVAPSTGHERHAESELGVW